MRRPAAALAATVLTTVVLAVPLASVGHAGPSGSVQCAGAATSPACPLLDQVAAQLAPVQPALAAAGPVTAQLVASVGGLAARADQPGGVSTAEATAQAEGLLDQLTVLPAPVRDLLAGTPLDGLVTTLEELVAALATPVSDDQSGAEGGSPTPADTGGSTSRSAGPTSPAVPSLGGRVSGSGGGATPATTSSPAIPDVPVGDSLTFAPLALPDFGFSPAVGLDPAPVVSEAVIEDVQDALNAAALQIDGDGTNVGLVVVASLLLLAAAWAAQAHQARQAQRTISD